MMELDPTIPARTSLAVRLSSAYDGQEGFEYLGVTTGYISWIFRNSRATSP
jgi:hypothetical protein